MTAPTQNRPAESVPPNQRLMSVDALRGFDMFWIMGGEGIFVALAALTGWPALQWWAGQLEHVPWHGFHAYDMIFPLFLFIAGISFPFSMAKRYQGEENRKALDLHVIRRGLLLVLLGLINNNAIRFDFANLRYGSVLGRIGLAWMFAALIFMNTSLKFRIIWLWGILISYWLLFLMFPAHDLGATDPFSMQGNLAGHIDRLLLPGKFCCYTYGDSEGILSTIPAISTALLGMLTGQFVMSQYLNHKPIRKVLYMASAAIGLMMLGGIWNIALPINKYLWSSSFVCFVGGLSLLLFTFFYLVIDIWNIKKWTPFFVVIGMNSITIYLAHTMIDFNYAAKFLFGGVYPLLQPDWEPLATALGTFVVAWLFLYFLYKKRIFLKV
jgi:predicted acyltransferase